MVEIVLRRLALLRILAVDIVPVETTCTKTPGRRSCIMGCQSDFVFPRAYLSPMRILSWNVLSTAGAQVKDVRRLIDAHRPDLVLLQEATAAIDTLTAALGGHYVRTPMGPRRHGVAAWSPRWFSTTTVALPYATWFDVPAPIFRDVMPRVAMVVHLDGTDIANVHLDHGQCANRRQLRHLSHSHPRLEAVVGDYNALGITGLPGFADVGPRRTTHWAHGFIPLRLDRCLVRNLRRIDAVALPRGASDHRPILVELIENSTWLRATQPSRGRMADRRL